MARKVDRDDITGATTFRLEEGMDTGPVYGIVTEGFSWTDLASPLHDVMGFDGVPDGDSLQQTLRAEIRLYTAAVLRHVPEEPLQPVPMGAVFLADESDVSIALRMDGYLKEGSHTGIPVGIVSSPRA